MIPAVGTAAYSTWRSVTARRAVRAMEMAEAKTRREERRGEIKREAQLRAERAARQALALKVAQATVVATVAKQHGVPMADLLGKSRFVEHIRARHDAMWRLHHEAKMSCAEISRRLGGLHHTTVLHGIRRHQERLDAATKAVS